MIREYMTMTIKNAKISESGLAVNLEVWDSLNECAYYFDAALLPNGWCIGKTDSTYRKDYGSVGGCGYGLNLSTVVNALPERDSRGIIWTDLQRVCLQASIYMPIFNNSITPVVDKVIENCIARYVRNAG